MLVYAVYLSVFFITYNSIINKLKTNVNTETNLTRFYCTNIMLTMIIYVINLKKNICIKKMAPAFNLKNTQNGIWNFSLTFPFQAGKSLTRENNKYLPTLTSYFNSIPRQILINNRLVTNKQLLETIRWLRGENRLNFSRLCYCNAISTMELVLW